MVGRERSKIGVISFYPILPTKARVWEGVFTIFLSFHHCQWSARNFFLKNLLLCFTLKSPSSSLWSYPPTHFELEGINPSKHHLSSLYPPQLHPLHPIVSSHWSSHWCLLERLVLLTPHISSSVDISNIYCPLVSKWIQLSCWAFYFFVFMGELNVKTTPICKQHWHAPVA